MFARSIRMFENILFLIRDPALTQGGTVFDAMLWSFVAMVSAVISAYIGAIFQPHKRLTAMILAFSCGLLISLLCFDLMKVALETGGIIAALTGFFLGLFTYVALNRIISSKGIVRRCSSSCGGLGMLTAEQQQEKATAIALLCGTAIDGIPESISIGISLLDNPLISLSVVTAVAVANIPEGLASGAGLSRSGFRLRQILLIWTSVVVLCVFSAAMAHILLESAPKAVKAIFTAFAGGGVLSMTLQTVIPEAYEETHDSVSILGGVGFAVAFCAAALFD